MKTVLTKLIALCAFPVIASGVLLLLAATFVVMWIQIIFEREPT